MYSTVSSMLRGSGRMIQRATRTTTGSLPLSKSLLRTLLKKVSVLRRKVASFLAGTRYQPGHLTEFCRKCSLCLRSIGVSYSGNPACSIKEVARDSCSSTRLGTHRYSGDDSQSGCGTQANTYSDRTRSQGASSDPGEGARHSTSCLQRGCVRASKQWPSTRPNSARCEKRLRDCGHSAWLATPPTRRHRPPTEGVSRNTAKQS